MGSSAKGARRPLPISPKTPWSSYAPIQAPAEWIARYKGWFDAGWDALREDIFKRQNKLGIVPAGAKLTSRPDGVPTRSSLTADQQKVAVRFMEVYAAPQCFEDAQIGRLIDELNRMGQFDNTLIIYVVGDNGADSQGRAEGLWNELADLVKAQPDSVDDRVRRSIGWRDQSPTASTQSAGPGR